MVDHVKERSRNVEGNRHYPIICSGEHTQGIPLRGFGAPQVEAPYAVLFDRVEFSRFGMIPVVLTNNKPVASPDFWNPFVVERLWFEILLMIGDRKRQILQLLERTWQSDAHASVKKEGYAARN